MVQERHRSRPIAKLGGGQHGGDGRSFETPVVAWNSDPWAPCGFEQGREIQLFRWQQRSLFALVRPTVDDGMDATMLAGAEGNDGETSSRRPL